MSKKKKELLLNIENFHRLEGEMRDQHAGKFALMHHGEVVHFFNDRADALMIGREKYPSGEFSVSPRIGQNPASLGASAQYVTPLPVK